MDDLIIASLQGLTTDEDEEALRVWRRAALQNERYYREMARAWRHAALLEPLAAATPPARLATRQRRFPLMRVAAAILLLAGAGAALLVLRRAPEPQLAVAELVTGANELVTTRLSDGTVVRLAGASRLRMNANGNSREVWLDGHAFFAVSHQQGSRFVVRTRAGDAVVLGTRFDVQVNDAGMQVFVLEGKVAHNAGGQEVQVHAMELSRARQGGGPDITAVRDPAPLLDWLGDFMVFRSTPIRDVARELERRFHVKVHLADESVGRRTVTAWFTDESLEDILLLVCRAADAHCLVGENSVTIEP